MPKRVLVVDDDFFFVEFLGELLEKRGYRVIKAHNGKEGLTKLEEGPFDILFSDLIMPKIDGSQFIQIARSKFPDASFHIIAVSGSVVEQMDQLSETGVDCFLAKGPLEQMEIQIHHLLDQLETGAFLSDGKGRFLEPGTMYPRQVTAELVDALNFHKGIIESAGFGMVVVDRDARVMNVNSQALDLLNASPADILNQHVTSLFPRQERAMVVEALKTVVRDQFVQKVRLHMVLNDKKVRLTVSLLKVLKDIAGWVIAMEDTDE